jgi:hypothetical protein
MAGIPETNMKMHPETIGYEMCDRDVKLNTCKWDDAATLTISGVDANGDVTYTHPRKNTLGNSVQVAHVVGATGGGNEDRALAVAVSALVVTVTFGTDSNGDSVVPTATALVAVVAALDLAAALVTAVAGGTGASAVSAAAAANLTGGTQTAVEDKKVNPATFLEEEWYECALVGVYEADGSLCADQSDADATGVLSVWDYCAHNQTDRLAIAYDLKDGALEVDESIVLADKYKHRAYAIVAPGIPATSGGTVRTFDGYIGHLGSTGKLLKVNSPTAKNLDPALAPGLSNIIRIYIYHPAGEKHSHILRLITYRPPGTT